MKSFLELCQNVPCRCRKRSGRCFNASNSPSSNCVNSTTMAREIASRTFSQIISSEDVSVGVTMGKQLESSEARSALMTDVFITWCEIVWKDWRETRTDQPMDDYWMHSSSTKTEMSERSAPRLPTGRIWNAREMRRDTGAIGTRRCWASVKGARLNTIICMSIRIENNHRRSTWISINHRTPSSCHTLARIRAEHLNMVISLRLHRHSREQTY